MTTELLKNSTYKGQQDLRTPVYREMMYAYSVENDILSLFEMVDEICNSIFVERGSECTVHPILNDEEYGFDVVWEQERVYLTISTDDKSMNIVTSTGRFEDIRTVHFDKDDTESIIKKILTWM